ncbi:MAG: hypothetical protein FWG11_08240, partial [Promicromonosporaceae bacterium]|nr:hypothetical protein [Promicromonosporaceae bacterium]
GEAIGFLGDHRTIFKIIAGLVTAVFVPAMVKSARASIASSAASVKAWVTQTAAAASSAAETAAIAGLYVLDWIKMAAGAVVNGAIVIGQWLAMAATAVAQAAVMAAAWLVSLGPVTLVIAAIVAVGVALALLWAKSQKFRDIVTGAFNAVKVAAQAVFGWIKSNWPLLLAILAGPIGLAVLAIARNWDKIKAGFSNALAAIKSAVAKGMAAVGAAISAGLNSAVNYVRGLPAKIAAFAGDMLAKGKHLGSSLINGLLDGLKGAGGMVSDLAASIKGAINSALHLPVVIKGPGPLPDFKIPAFAAGTRNFAGGYALVGERGPEVVRLPRGTDVFPAGATQQMLGGSTAGSAMTAADARLIAQELAAVLGAPRIVNVTVPTDDPTAAAMAVVNRLATV